MAGAFLLAVLGSVRLAAAQQAPGTQEVVLGEKAYAYVEAMPELPGGGGNRAIVQAIQSRVKYPQEALRKGVMGKVLVSFIVGENGAVRSAKVVKGIGAGCDEAVLEAVRQLPSFKPGTQSGKPVPVSFTVPITFEIPDKAGPVPDSIAHVYTLVNQMPQLASGGGTTGIALALQQALVAPAELPNAGAPNKVFVSFTVGPEGGVFDVKIVRSLNAACDAAAVAAVRKLPRFAGGQLNGKPVSVRLTVPVAFAAAPPKP
jgi:TonB family protein